ncbi:LemA family protein [Phascolarctobacterium sp.]|uniref:LemA family protein n=1 Tax=Phascolarctobacterium sp. TaxID=2049039 RepID=UPI00386E7703
MSKGLLGAIAAIIIAVVMMFSSYNGLVSMNENVTGKWAQVENQLQRRNDLIPNLVNTVKGYAAHETQVFKDVSDARAKLGGAKTVAETSAANSQMNSALSRLLMVAENYPDLKANTNFTQLQDELAGTENRIAVARKDYNDAVQGYNAKIKSLPASLYAGAFGFTARDYFKADEAAQKVPQVKF